MIKKSLKKAITTDVFAEEKPEKKKKEKAKKEYTNLIEPQELLIADKAKLVFSASVPKDAEEESVHLDIRTFIVNPDPDKYSGPTQKGINFDVEYLDEVIELLKGVSEGLAKQGK